ncbi:YqeB family protein [Pseudonocardia endophytica]|uniref:Uncharacterized protein n=1 Tax=Pseudonocardia endophytica TaxID=401976 RepID=A0A4R1IAH3_PSEEN|nr:hypothetical protein [Pseudonocardia endophytica]TCK27332.1 hypothetical protein EV378_3202 [Pseudonocardia endophytica]
MTTVRMSEAWPWMFRLAGPVVGAGVGAVVAPVVRWLLERFDAAPGPLRILASLPTVWAVVVCAVLGLAGGIWLAAVARKEGLAVTVDAAAVTLDKDGDAVRLPRDQVACARRDGRDLVLLDRDDTELARRDASDLSWPRLRAAFGQHGYRWDASSARDDRFRRWVDGDPDLGTDEHELLRTRARALSDDRRGTAAELRDRLQKRGVVVRDRASSQEIRRAVAG